MDNQHKKIKGYRDLSQEEIDLMNEVKELAVTIEILVDKILNTNDIDTRWCSIAKTDLQTGFMALVRSIARPTTF